MTDPYLSRGVSATKTEVVEAISGLPDTAYPGAFCQVLPAGNGRLEIIHADGAGTKSTIAYMLYKETGDPSWFRGIATDSVVMNLDDMICVGATDNFLLSNTIGRNAHRVPGEVLKEIVEGYSDFAQSMTKLGVGIRLCGGETADVGDLTSTVIVDSTVYCNFDESDMLDASGIRANQVIVALASFGKATYEDKVNSGIGSNGLTMARHTLLHKDYRNAYPETYSATIDPDQVYCGPYKLQDKLEGTEQTIGEALLSPTRSFAPVIKRVLDRYSENVSGIIHCTGGGLTKSIKFGDGVHFIKDDLFELPKIFECIASAGNIPQRDMWKIFNCGQRMEIYCDESAAQEIMSISSEFNIDAKIIGRTEVSETGENKITVRHGGSEEVYTKSNL